MFLTVQSIDFKSIDSKWRLRYPRFAVSRPEAPAERFRFGPYEADARTRELRKRGVRVKLRDKSFEILVALLERPGQAITRKELRRRLWPEGTFVEFDGSLNSAMNRLRNALRDRSAKPRYVETLPRVGYRFIRAVEQVATIRPRLAVLPFENLSPDPENAFLCDAVTEALITELGSVGALRVVSRQSVLHLRGTRSTAPQVARELSVDAIVEGSALRTGGHVRISAQLIQAAPEQHLWANAYECGIADLLTIQGQIARAIAEAIQAALTSGEMARLSRPRPLDLEAHVAYLKGRHLVGQRSREGFEGALNCFRLALEKDPTHALAAAHLADCYASLGFWGFAPFPEAFRRARESAVRALALDPFLSTAHWAFAWVTWVLDWDLARCEAETHRAIELNPSDEGAHVMYSVFLSVARGERARAAAEATLALELDPLSQHVSTCAAWVYLFTRKYRRAIQQARRTLELFPGSLQAYYVIGLAERCRLRYSEAIAALEKALAISPDPLSMAYFGAVQAEAGNPSIARSMLQDLFSRRGREPVLPRCFVLLHGALGEKDEAFKWLEEARRAHDPGVFFLRVMPLYDPLHLDPRFKEMLRCVGLLQD